MPPELTIVELADRVGGRVAGDGATRILGVATLEDAGPGDLAFVIDSRYAARWPDCAAAAVIVTESVALPDDPRPVVRVPDAERAMIVLLELFAPPAEPPDAGVHPTAWVHPDARIADGARIGAHVSVERGSRVGAGTILHPGVRLYPGVTIGEGSELHAGVVVREGCVVGSRVILHPNVVIGADGFGYRPAPDGRGLVKVPQIGTVRIEDDVEVGANTCIDRAKTGATVIGAGTKIDDLVMIGHNCRIGRSCVIAGAAAIAGSTVLGDGVQVGGGAGISDHAVIEAGARIAAMTGVAGRVPAGATWLGLPGGPHREVLRQWSALRKLPELIRGATDRKIAGGPDHARDT